MFYNTHNSTPYAISALCYDKVDIHPNRNEVHANLQAKAPSWYL